MSSIQDRIRDKAAVGVPVNLSPDLTAADLNDNIMRVAVANEIVHRRKALGFSQTALAEKIGVSQAMVSQYECGDYNFTIESLCKVLDALGIKPVISFQELPGKKANIVSFSNSKRKVNNPPGSGVSLYKELKEE